MRTPPWTRRVHRIAAGAVIIACSGGSTGPGSGDVASVEIAPTETTIIVGTTASFRATAHDRGGGVLDGRRVFWNSESPEVATVSDAGVVTGGSPGTTRIAASVEGTSALAVVTVQPKPVATVTVFPDNVTLRMGRTVRLEARLADADGQPLGGRRVDWASTNPGVARVDGSGVVSGVAEGAAVITATSEGKRASAAVTVTPAPSEEVPQVRLSPADTTIRAGAKFQLRAEVTGGSDGEGKLEWRSSDDKIAKVSGSGMVTGVREGVAVITATTEGGRRGMARVAVLPNGRGG
jgi:uncharacterized protein YjdB